MSGRPELGIQGVAVPEFYQYYYRMPAGVYVNAVVSSSDAAKKGIEVKDIILAVDGERISTTEEIEAILYNHQPGDVVTVIIYRSGYQYEVDIILGESVS